MIRLRSFSVTLRLVLLVVLAALPAIGVFLGTGYNQRQRAVNKGFQNSIQIVRTLAANQEQSIAGTEQLLATLATIPQVRALDPEVISPLLQELVEKNLEYLGIFGVSAKGLLLVSSIPLTGKRDISDRPYFQETIQRRRFTPGSFIISRFDDRPAFPAAYPVLNERGDVEMVLVAGLNPLYFARYLSTANLPQGSMLVVTDRYGTVLNRKPAGEAAIGKPDRPESMARMSAGNDEGTFTETGTDGIERLCAYKRLHLSPEEGPYLYIRVGVPVEKYTGPSRRAMIRNLIILGLATILCGGLAGIIGRAGVVEPIRRLVAASSRLGKGDLSARTMMSGGGGEIGQLARAFDEMAQALESRETERDRAEKAWRLAQYAIDRTQDMVFWVLSDGRIAFVNEAACRGLGYTQDELLERKVFDFDTGFSPEDWPRHWDELRRRKSLLFESCYRAKNGEQRVVEIAANLLLVEGEEIDFGFVRDINERKTAEKQLQLNYFSMENAMDAVYWVMEDGRFTYANLAAQKMLGYSKEELLRSSVPDIDPSFQSKRWTRKWAEFTEAGAMTFESMHRRKDGRLLPVEISLNAKPFRGQNYLFCFVRDISLRKDAEEALRQSEEKFAKIFHNNPDAVLLAQFDGKIIDVNPGFCNLFKISREEAVDSNTIDLGIWVDLSERQRMIEVLRSRGELSGFEIELQRSDGTRFFGLLSGQYVEVNQMACNLEVVRDITERKRSEESLRQAQKLESLGVLAGGIAHDFNNLLTAILGNLNLCQMSLPEDSSVLEYLDSAERTVLRAADLTKQMLAYSGKGRFVVRSHNLNQVVMEMTHLLRVSISKKVNLEFQLGEDLPPIHSDAAQIQQVVMNLVTNASEAIGDNAGTIRISTGERYLDEESVQRLFPGQNLRPGPKVTLEVNDSGCGITPDVMSRIFDPFFTTKVEGRGLGLSAMLGILRGHSAGITINSEVGCGSTFELFFPASETVEQAPLEAETDEGSEQLSGTVLLVDDETDIREATGNALTAMGFSVVTASDGIEAVERFKATPDEFALVLMDLTMPRMDGREAFELIRKINPRTLVLLSSGYSEQESVQELLSQGLAGFIQKPYQYRELRKTIRATMHSGGG